jgi:hypothetical protein
MPLGIPIPPSLPGELSGASLGVKTATPGNFKISFEAERKANMEKGMAELERRRDAIRQRYLFTLYGFMVKIIISKI